MVYLDATDQQGIVDLARNIAKADANTFPEKRARIYLNNALDDYVYMAITSANTWQFDDSSYTDFPIATTNIVASQQDYEIDTTFLMIRRVEMKDSNGNWTKLQQVDEFEYRNRALSEITATDSGLPYAYYLKANSIFLIAVPDTNVTAGLKVFYERNVTKFDGTAAQVPGIPSIHQPFLAYKAAGLFAIQENRANKNDIFQLIENYNEEILDFYARRDKAKKPLLRVNVTPSY